SASCENEALGATRARLIQNIRAIGWLVARGSFTPSCGMGDFKKLLVWQKAHAMALNSTTALEYHLIAARDLQVVRGSDSLTFMSQVVEVRKMLYGLRRYLASQSKDSKQA
ncbi:MAG: hypothetical protein ABR543_08285, partial [Gemmatimonadaceae bacterium]